MKHIFKFKQFEVDQRGCAMKINTDGVLLGAIAEFQSPKNILDIGTGTGVIALMLGQRFPDASVAAVEIDHDAAATADRNFQASSFSSRLSVFHAAIEAFETAQRFDLIVSNPPFFVNDYKNAEPKKQKARHASDNFFSQLLAKVNDLLTDEGSFWFVLPLKQTMEVVAIGNSLGLSVNTVVNLHSDNEKPVFRQIVELSRVSKQLKEVKFVIYEQEKVYTDAYRALLKDFFLAY